MQRIAPLDPSEVPDLDGRVRQIEHDFGFMPNSVRTFARKPELLSAILDLNSAILGTGTVSRWNDTIETTLEEAPEDWATRNEEAIR